MSERKIREWALPHVKNRRTYVDIGACQGDTTNPFISEFERVIAFEPNPSVFDKISDKAEKYNLGLGDQEEVLEIVLPNGIEHPEHGSITRYNTVQYSIAHSSTVQYSIVKYSISRYNIEEYNIV